MRSPNNELSIFQPIVVEKYILVLGIDIFMPDYINQYEVIIRSVIDLCSQQKEGYKEIYIVSSTANQTIQKDLNRAISNAQRDVERIESCVDVLQVFKRALRSKLKENFKYPPQVQIMLFSINDIINEYNTGKYLSSMSIEFYKTLFSPSKYRYIGLTDPLGNNISYMSDCEFSAWYASTTEEILQYDLYTQSVSREEYDAYYKWRCEWYPTEWEIPNKHGKNVPILCTPAPAAYLSPEYRFTDDDKCLFIYGLTNFLLSQEKEQHYYTIVAFDNRATIQDSYNFYQRNRSLLSKQCVYHTMQIDNSRVLDQKIVIGEGERNELYETDMRDIIQSCQETKKTISSGMVEYLNYVNKNKTYNHAPIKNRDPIKPKVNRGNLPEHTLNALLENLSIHNNSSQKDQPMENNNMGIKRKFSVET